MTTHAQRPSVRSSSAGDTGPAARARVQPGVDYELVGTIRTAVLDRLEQYTDRHQLDRHDQQQLLRSWLQEELGRESRRRMVDGGGLPQLSPQAEVALIQAVENAIWGLGPWQGLLDIPDVQDIYLAGARLPMLRMRDGRIEQACQRIVDSDEELTQQIQHIAAYHGSSERAFSPSQPRLDMQLPDGSRMSALRDVAPYPIVTIRRHHLVDVTLAMLVELGMLSEQMARFLAVLVQARCSILVTGRPVSGKTTLLRALAAVISALERFATLETEFELNLHRIGRHPLIVPLECRMGSTEIDPSTGRRAGEITLSDLVHSVLRQSVTRVIVGEVRGEEALPMLEVMNAGMPGSMCTLHASSPSEAFDRLITAALRAGGQGWSDNRMTRLAASGIKYVVQLRHIDHTGAGAGQRRFVSEIAEVTDVNEAGVVAMNQIFGPERGSGDPRGVFQTLPQIRDPFDENGIDLSFLHDRELGWQSPLQLGVAWRRG